MTVTLMWPRRRTLEGSAADRVGLIATGNEANATSIQAKHELSNFVQTKVNSTYVSII